ncbi:MAG: rRNA maturation RNase YbeY [Chitinivibrionales bacterium]|nr:rRNA maturation RNase YbeY [Chitinivibrionales bacterium]MBD3394340.1 rRNA maturation RNase YbeY [Chitinivibrionales bacterium]
MQYFANGRMATEIITGSNCGMLQVFKLYYIQEISVNPLSFLARLLTGTRKWRSPNGEMTSNFRFFHDYKSLPMPRRRLAAMAAKLARGERLGGHTIIDVILCSDYRIRLLNKRFRRKDRATDVLAFPFNDRDLLGEIYISLQRAAVQARRYGLAYPQEVERLLVHGALHLRGYDHRTKQQRRRMESRERKYCALGGTRAR